MQGRKKPSTNEFYRNVLDSAVRAHMMMMPDEDGEVKQRNRRLSSLYGYNSSSEMVRSRATFKIRAIGERGFSLAPKGSGEKTDANKNGNSMIEGGQGNKPWYLGWQNSASPPIGKMKEATQRYGYAGALNLKRLQEASVYNRSVDLQITNLVQEHSLPNFRGEKSIANEYVDPLEGRPGSWPYKAQYVSGSSLKKPDPEPRIPDDVYHFLVKVEQELSEFNASLVREKKEQEEVRNRFRILRPELRINRTTGKPTEEKNKLISEHGRMKYSHGLTIVTPNAHLKLRGSKIGLNNEQRKHHLMQLRWSETFYIFKLLRSSSVHLKMSMDDLENLLNELRDAALKEDDLGCEHISRDGLVSFLCTKFERGEQRRFNKLFSGFDPHKTDRVDYRLIVCTLRCFLHFQGENSVSTLISIWDIMEHGRDRLILNHEELSEIHMLGCITEADENAILSAMQKILAETVASETELSPQGFLHREEYLRQIQNPENDCLIKVFQTLVGRQVESAQMFSPVVLPHQDEQRSGLL